MQEEAYLIWIVESAVPFCNVVRKRDRRTPNLTTEIILLERRNLTTRAVHRFAKFACGFVNLQILERLKFVRRLVCNVVTHVTTLPFALYHRRLK